MGFTAFHILLFSIDVAQHFFLYLEDKFTFITIQLPYGVESSPSSDAYIPFQLHNPHYFCIFCIWIYVCYYGATFQLCAWPIYWPPLDEVCLASCTIQTIKCYSIIPFKHNSTPATMPFLNLHVHWPSSIPIHMPWDLPIPIFYLYHFKTLKCLCNLVRPLQNLTKYSFYFKSSK